MILSQHIFTFSQNQSDGLDGSAFKEWLSNRVDNFLKGNKKALLFDRVAERSTVMSIMEALKYTLVGGFEVSNALWKMDVYVKYEFPNCFTYVYVFADFKANAIMLLKEFPDDYDKQPWGVLDLYEKYRGVAIKLTPLTVIEEDVCGEIEEAENPFEDLRIKSLEDAVRQIKEFAETKFIPIRPSL